MVETQIPLKSIELEQSVLGGMLARNDWIPEISAILQPCHFSEEAHAKIYDAILNQYHRGGNVDGLALRPLFAAEPLLAASGGGQYLEDMEAAALVTAPLVDHAKMILNLYKSRQFHTLFEDSLTLLQSPGEDFQSILQGIEHNLGLAGKLVSFGSRKSKFLSAASLAGLDVPERRALVEGMIPMDTVTLFSGDGGTGKSLLTMQLAVAVATGSEWLGKYPSAGNAIYMSAEDSEEELHRRLADIARSKDMDLSELDGLKTRSLAGEDALLAIEGRESLVESALYRELSAQVAADKPQLVVIDTLADVYPANENDRAKVRQFVGILRRLALEHKCAVVLLSHPSLSGLSSGSGTSGSTAWNNSVRSRLYLQRVKD